MTVDPNEAQEGHPAWQEVLQHVPEELHGLVKPALGKWDENYQKSVNGLQEQLEQYEGWQEFVDNNVDPGQAEQALRFAVLLEQDPETVIRQLQEHFGLDNQGSQGTNDQGEYAYDDDDDEDDPRYAELYEQFSKLENTVLTQQEQDAIADAEVALDDELDALAEEYGDYDEFIVLSMIKEGLEPEDAVKQFKDRYPNWVDPDSQADDDGSYEAPGSYYQGASGFVPMGNGGSNNSSGVPNEPIRPGEMTRQQTDEFVTNLLRAAAQQDS